MSLPSDALHFRGRDRLIALLDAAAGAGDAEAVTARLREALCTLMDDPDVQLPNAVFTPIDAHYARRELYRSPDLGYSVVAMTWGPGQATPLHDHCGLWCVEGVWSGRLEITQYELLERDGERARFRAHGGIAAGTGSAGSLIPPHEYHTIRNPAAGDIAVSLHVYEAPLETCTVFEPQPDGSYLRALRTLPRDA
ncbi:cysteine dioxygenase [Coralloluteibacterium thermophilus]|uniref:Cysteine dioxygenase n=1 Tax=Coralloluteibacterium thermophilum TaxID=2707049 RepID=A0ABV9NRM4_9GAMM